MPESEIKRQPTESERLRSDILNLRDLITRTNLFQNPGVKFPLDVNELERLKPIVIVDNHIDFPEAGNRAGVQISAIGEWLVSDGESIAYDLDVVLEDYALATREDYLALEKRHSQESRDITVQEEKALEKKQSREIARYMSANRISLMIGFKTALEHSYLQLLANR